MKNRFQNLPFKFQLAALHSGGGGGGSLSSTLFQCEVGLYKFANAVAP
jgi:hypothetical protein